MTASPEWICPHVKKCGGCQYQGIPYTEQLKKKQNRCESLLNGFGAVSAIVGMDDPLYYRNKVHAVFGLDRKGNPIYGTYEEGTHRIVRSDGCLIEDRKCREIIETISGMLRSFKIRVYDEDSGRGLLRHVLVRRGFQTGEIMVVLVAADPVFPSKNNFLKALRRAHPEITTVVLNLNDRRTSMVLGERSIPMYGPGFIRDRLCGLSFRLSPTSFYQVNPVQTERLYETAVRFAGLTGKEKVLDAYCGIGTIGMTAASHAAEVTGIELNREAVRDARINARENGIRNIRFFEGDAGAWMKARAEEGMHPDVLLMDPPRTGSDERFLAAAVKASPGRIVYISCEPDTLARDLKYLTQHGYRVQALQPFDQFPFTDKCEVAAALVRKKP